MKSDMIHINKITEHEDGSATVEVEMLEESYRKIFEYGLQMLFIKAVEDVERGNDEWKKCVSCGGPSKSDFCGFCIEEE